MAIDSYIDKIDDLLEEAWNLPLMNKRRAVDIEKIRELLDDIRMNIPQEIKEAKGIVSDREDLLSDARREAAEIVRQAEARQKQLLSDEEIIKAAKNRATQLLSDTQSKTREMERAAIDFSEGTLRRAEEALATALSDIKSTRIALRNKGGASRTAKKEEQPPREPKD